MCHESHFLLCWWIRLLRNEQHYNEAYNSKPLFNCLCALKFVSLKDENDLLACACNILYRWELLKASGNTNGWTIEEV